MLKSRGLIENNTGSMTLKDSLDLEKQELSKLEREFNSTLIKYKSNYKQYLEELMTRQVSDNNNIKNKVVNYNNEKYWVNSNGIIRKFSENSWISKSNTCSEPVSTINTNDFNNLTQGVPMGNGEECNSGGFNAADEGSGTVAWVDEQGYKHIYEDPLDRNESCKKTSKGDDKIISSIAFNAMPTGSPYDNTNTCDMLNTDLEKWEIIKNLNTKLINIVNKMNTKVKEINSVDKNINTDITNVKQQLTGIVRKLEIERNKIRKEEKLNNSLDLKYNEKYLEIKSSNLKRVIWLLVELQYQ